MSLMVKKYVIRYSTGSGSLFSIQREDDHLDYLSYFLLHDKYDIDYVINDWISKDNKIRSNNIKFIFTKHK